jgi:hypothetical protein
MGRGSLLTVAVLGASLAACTGGSVGTSTATSSAVAASTPRITWLQVDAALTQPPPVSWKVVKAGPLTIRVPPAWLVTPFLGEPATVDFPLVHISTFKLAGPCGSLVRAIQKTTDCFGHYWSVPPDGVLLAWSDVQIPGPTEYHVQPGRPMSIGRYRGKLNVDSDAQGTQIDAAVRVPGGHGEFIQMTDQVGPATPRATVTDTLLVLDSMLLSR